MLVPILDEIICGAADHGARHAVLGMAHRGRLNVLAHVLDKPYTQILAEFKDPVAAKSFRTDLGWIRADGGDHHAGARTAAPRGQMYVTLAPNPSHLEAVNPVVEGMVRASQDFCDQPGAPIATHTRASRSRFTETRHSRAGCGRGDAQSRQSAWIHDRRHDSHHRQQSDRLHDQSADSRSTLYASDLAKGFEIPIMHVNADDPEACLMATRMAMAYRDRFGKDFLIDLVGYRRWGHNEGDEPLFTQPRCTRRSASIRPSGELWGERLVAEGVVAGR